MDDKIGTFCQQEAAESVTIAKIEQGPTHALASISSREIGPDEEELHSSEEVDADQEWRCAQLQFIPEHELGDEIPESHQQTEHGNGESRHGGDAQGYLRVVGDAQHGYVVQRVD